MKQGMPDHVRRAAGGDRTAFAWLVEAHWARLVGLARSVVGEATAEDAVQDALVVAWRRLKTLRDIDAFPSWLTRIVLRQCLRRKRSWRDFLPISAVTEPALEPNPDADIDLDRCLRALAPRQRAVMFFTVVEGRSDSDIAALMGISAASVRSHRRRARQRLDRLLSGAQHGS